MWSYLHTVEETASDLLPHLEIPLNNGQILNHVWISISYFHCYGWYLANHTNVQGAEVLLSDGLGLKLGSQWDVMGQHLVKSGLDWHWDSSRLAFSGSCYIAREMLEKTASLISKIKHTQISSKIREQKYRR